jgi:hypothetical protein
VERVGEHPVPAGPLAVRWLAYELPRLRAGAYGQARLALENGGTATWHGVVLSYHWLDDRGNAIVWDGWRTELEPLAPGEGAETPVELQAPMPPARYRLAFDLVLEGRYWLSEVGNSTLDLDVEVEPRIRRALAVEGADVSGQEEPLVPRGEAEAVAYLAPGCEPAPDWSRRVLDAHQEGYAVVAGSLDGRGGGRDPSFAGPFVCPSVVLDARGEWVEAELPTFRPAPAEPAVFDGRIRARLRSGRRRG